MTDLNDVRVEGRLIKEPDLKPIQGSPWGVLNFTIAVEGTKYNGRTKQSEVTTTFVSVEHWVPVDSDDEAIPGKGDKVRVEGELSQYIRPEEQERGETRGHTRVVSKVLTIMRRAARTRPAPSPQQTEDPWAPSSGGGN